MHRVNAHGTNPGDCPRCSGRMPDLALQDLVPILNRFTSGGVDHVAVDCLEPFPEVRGYVARFMALDPVKAWYAASK